MAALQGDAGILEPEKFVVGDPLHLGLISRVLSVRCCDIEVILSFADWRSFASGSEASSARAGLCLVGVRAVVSMTRSDMIDGISAL